ncbi:MAG: beta-galactosidase [Planctomycetes bacterium]|nr:beta-galactosidase [Planctomycetota bacterium]
MLQAEVKVTDGFPVIHVNGEAETGFAFCSVAGDLSGEGRGAAGERIAGFRDAGIHWYTFGVGLGPFLGQGSFWTGPGEYDCGAVDDMMDFVLSADGDARVLLRVAVDAPEWWKETHPDDIAVGWDERRGYFREEWLQSYSSRAWRSDAGEALREYVGHVEKTYGENVVGYHVCAEASHEWSYGWWGTLHDYGRAQAEGFRVWLKEKHCGSVEKLRESWKDVAVTFETASIPPGESRKEGDYFEYFDPSKGRQRIEYLEYHNATVAEAICGFASAVKEETERRKLCGVFYGYYFFGENALLVDVGHRALKRVLESADVDFIACPYNYRERHSGGATITQAIAGSVRLGGKVCYVEDDTRTHLSPEKSGYGRAERPEDTTGILKRNHAFAVTGGCSMWWMEQTPGWFSDPEILGTIGAMERIGREMLREREAGSAAPGAQTAVFVSDESARYMRYSKSLIEPQVNEFCVEHLPRMGAPYEVFMVSDITGPGAEEAFEGHRFCIFLNVPYLDAEQRAAIREKIACRGRTVLWMGAAGYISEEGLSAGNVSELTGMEIVEGGLGGKVRVAVTDFDDEMTKEMPRNQVFGSNEATGPLFWCVDADAKHLGELYCMPAVGTDWRPCEGMIAGKTGLAAKEFGDWRSVWCGAPNVPSALLRGIARKAGAHVYVDTDDVVYANSRMVAVHARYPGPRHVMLPGAAKVRDAYTGKTVADGAVSFDVMMARGETRVWVVEAAGS